MSKRLDLLIKADEQKRTASIEPHVELQEEPKTNPVEVSKDIN